MNLKKKIVALGMVFALALGMATSVFAGANDKITDMRYIGVDAPHGTIYGLDSSGQLVNEPVHEFQYYAKRDNIGKPGR